MTDDETQRLERIARSLTKSTSAGALSIADLARLIAEGIAIEREHTKKQLDFLKRKITLLEIHIRGMRNRERVQAVERDDDE